MIKECLINFTRNILICKALWVKWANNTIWKIYDDEQGELVICTKLI